ncbi:MAG: tartrate dehydrogenase [candidate division NC10 bacterium]|nr:tartrate dehydrogenase [candidate division NC10 bacterium]
MSRYRIAVIPGDGVGVEVVAEGIKVLEATAKVVEGLGFKFTSFGWGSEFYLRHGQMMPSDALDVLRDFDAIYLGAMGDPRIPDHITLEALLSIRRGFDQYICLRPAYLYPGVPTPLAGKKPGAIDMVVIRENTEGEYADVGGRIYRGTEAEVAVQAGVFTRRGTERVIRYAFELARSLNKKKRVTSVTKSNAMRHSMVMWDWVFRAVAQEYPDIESGSLLVDAACMNFVRKPETFDVVVASNLFGDILTDLSAAIVGSMGLAPSANLNPERRFPSMFEPVHGSAPDIAGKGIVNPLAAILTAGMMLEFLGEARAAASVKQAVEKVLVEAEVRTPDLGGSSKTSQVGEAVVSKVAELDREG